MNISIKKVGIHAFCVVLGALALSACGSSGDESGGNTAGAGDPVIAPPPAPDIYVARVGTLVASASDDADPVDVEGIALTLPEDTEPLAVN